MSYRQSLFLAFILPLSPLVSSVGCDDGPPGETDDVTTLDENGNVLLYPPYRGEYPGAGGADVGKLG